MTCSIHPGRQIARNVLLLGACTGLLAGLATAQTVPAAEGPHASRLSRVTVYAGSAVVERTVRVATGARSLTLTCLPAGIDAQTLQVDADAGIRWGELQVRTEEREAQPSCASALDGRIRALEDQIAQVRAEAMAEQVAQGYLRSVAGLPAQPASASAAGGVGPVPAPGQIGATADALRRATLEAQTRSHQIERRLQALEQSLRPLQAERDRTAQQRSRVTTVTLRVAAERDGDLRLAYTLRGPGWQPTYRASLDTARRTVTMERQALVAQASGEDWVQVPLVLSTGQSLRATQGRLPRSSTWDVAPPPPPPTPAAAAANLAMPAPAPVMLARAAEAPPPSFDVTVTEGRFATEFSVPQRITVPSGSEKVALTLETVTLPATVLSRVAPAVEPVAYVVAELPTPPGVWPSASVTLLRDGSQAGTGRLDGAASPWALSFGRDELLVVQADTPQDQTATAGFGGTRTERRLRRDYRIESRHRSPVTLQVLHAAPLSRHERIEIESRYQPPVVDAAWNRQPGLVAWRQELAPGTTASFSAEHWVRYPRDLAVVEKP
ncbi:DUF4139 domain-containing protein [Acidovorax lacteus]|uniref:Mucoidy inhibitor MuiA n=1 Tax=Acidovorax lacteus TaxID=1924988 RepID=A0ABP8LCG0_9BURK